MILTTLDTSPTGETALVPAVHAALAFGEPLTLLLVIDGQLRHHFDERGRDIGRSVDEVARDYLDSIAERLRAEHEGLDVATTAVHGTDTAAVIVEAAAEPGVRMLAMSTHGRSGLSRVFAGSVTTHVLRTSTRPVLVVPPERSDPPGS